MVAPSGTAYKPVAPLASGEAECGGCARFWSARGKRRDLRLEGPDFGTRAPVVDVVVLRSAVFEAEDNELAPAITISNGIASATSSSFTIITSSIAPSSIAPSSIAVITGTSQQHRRDHHSRCHRDHQGRPSNALLPRLPSPSLPATTTPSTSAAISSFRRRQRGAAVLPGEGDLPASGSAGSARIGSGRRGG